VDDAAIGKHYRHAQHVVAHGAVADGSRSGRARRGHAANRGVGAGIDREHQAGIFQVRIELEASESSLDRNIKVFRIETQHPGHARQVDRDAALDRVDMAFE
jgi:hypothetical protein